MPPSKRWKGEGRGEEGGGGGGGVSNLHTLYRFVPLGEVPF